VTRQKLGGRRWLNPTRRELRAPPEGKIRKARTRLASYQGCEAAARVRVSVRARNRCIEAFAARVGRLNRDRAHARDWKVPHEQTWDADGPNGHRILPAAARVCAGTPPSPPSRRSEETIVRPEQRGVRHGPAEAGGGITIHGASRKTAARGGCFLRRCVRKRGNQWGKEERGGLYFVVERELSERRAQRWRFQAHRTIRWPHCKTSERAVRLDEAETRGSGECLKGRRAHRARP
jgi:hypothetical protein